MSSSLQFLIGAILFSLFEFQPLIFYFDEDLVLGSFYLCLYETCILLMAGPSQGYRESFLHAVNHSNLGSAGTGL